MLQGRAGQRPLLEVVLPDLRFGRIERVRRRRRGSADTKEEGSQQPDHAPRHDAPLSALVGSLVAPVSARPTVDSARPDQQGRLVASRRSQRPVGTAYTTML